jgi:membrane protease YdiL (CAAX protease family)
MRVVPSADENVLSDPSSKWSWRKQWLPFLVGMCGMATFMVVCATTVGMDESPPLMFDLILAGALPAAAWGSLRRLRAGKVPPTPRLKRYRLHTLSICALGLFAFAVFTARHTHLRNVGFSFQSNQTFFGWCLVLGVGSAAIGWLFHWLKHHGFLRPGPLDPGLSPQTRPEKLACLFVLVPTVGFCEELLYRSYVLNEIPHWWKGCPTAVSLLVSCLLFGLAHMSQGSAGVLQVFLMGALWACPVVYSGTLYPSIVIHTLYDAVVLVWVGPKLAPRAKCSPPSPV